MRYVYLLIPLLLLNSALFAQQKKRNKSANTLAAQKKSESFLDKQFWLGFKAGANITNPNIKNSFQVVQATNYLHKEKKYDSYSVFGSQAGLEITFYIKGFSVSLQPTYSRVGYAHQSVFNWFDPNNTTNSVTLTYAQQHRLEYFEWPLLVKYDLTRSKLRPFVQGGFYYARLIDANTSLKISGVDLASGGINEFADETLFVGSKDIFAKNVWGVSAGVGVHYHLGNVRLVLDANYRIGMSLANKTENRYQNDRLSGIGETPDNLMLNNIVVSAGCVFPMRYLSTSLKALDRK
jgi:hypothetical protein